MVAISITRRHDGGGAAVGGGEAPGSTGVATPALALVLVGVDRTTAAETCGMDRQTLGDWVHRYNAEGVAGLTNRRGASRPARLDPAQAAGLVSWVEAGPDPAVDGVVR